MFPPANFDPQSSKWVRAIEETIEKNEQVHPRLDAELTALQRENNGVLNQVSSRVNAYYTATMAQYPVFQRTIPMSDVLGGESATISVSAPAAASTATAETWVTALSYTLPLPITTGVMGIRLNGAQFGLLGPSAYRLRFRWRVGTTTEGINTTPWMSRHQFNLSEYSLNPTTPVLTNVANRYTHWTGTATSVATVSLQMSILNISNRSLAVAAQDITLRALNNNNQPTYLDVMVSL